jgi:hypothetical protein
LSDKKKTHDNITIHNNYFCFSTINPKDFLVSLKYTDSKTKIIFKPVKLLKSNQLYIYIYIYIYLLIEH